MATEDELAWSRRILEAGPLAGLLTPPATACIPAEAMAALRQELDSFAWTLVSRLSGVLPGDGIPDVCDSGVEIPLDMDARTR